MVLDAGIATVKRGHNTAANGEPMNMVYDIDLFVSYYGEKTVGFNRFFTAKENGLQADLLIEIQRFGGIVANKDIVELRSFKDSGVSGEYKILQVQHVLNDDGLPMTDLTLERISPIEEG